LERGITSPYDLWVREDVLYIITAEERLAFAALQSDGERERFIEEFWRRRDPVPDTVENEFREEHYRRIAYSNERFAWDGISGWKTDRGRFYISLGPPDENESHTSGGPMTPPFEIWRYRHVEGAGDNLSFTFLDSNRTGEFTLTANLPPATAELTPILEELSRQIQNASVDLSVPETATISIPESSRAAQFDVYARINRVDQQGVMFFEWGIQYSVSAGRSFPTQSVLLKPGLYILNVVLTDTATQISHSSVRHFRVK
jgi:GWxTD domain-containing protein